MPVPRPSYPMYPSATFQALAESSGVPMDLARGLGLWMQRVMDQQAVDERLNYQWINDNISGGGGGGQYAADFLVAANDAPDSVKASAQYVCDGTADQVEINAAITAAAALPSGGTVLLSSGIFHISDEIQGALFVTLRGYSDRTATTIVQVGGFAGTCMYNGNVSPWQRIQDIFWDCEDSSLDIIYDLGHDCQILDCYLYGGNSSINRIRGGGLIRGCTFAPATYGIILNSAAIYDLIVNNFFFAASGDQSAISATNATEILIGGNTFSEFGRSAVVFNGVMDSMIFGNSMSNNGRAASNTYDTILLTDSDRNIITANRLHKATSGNVPRYGINISNAGCNDNMVVANHFINSGATGSFNDAGTNTNGALDAAMNFL